MPRDGLLIGGLNRDGPLHHERSVLGGEGLVAGAAAATEHHARVGEQRVAVTIEQFGVAVNEKGPLGNSEMRFSSGMGSGAVPLRVRWRAPVGHRGLHRIGIGLVGLDPRPPFWVEHVGQSIHAGLRVDAALLAPGDGDLIALIGINVGVHDGTGGVKEAESDAVGTTRIRRRSAPSRSGPRLLRRVKRGAIFL